MNSAAMTKENISCSFIILNYKDAQTTVALVNEIADYKLIKSIVVVDNCSPDDSYHFLSSVLADKPKISVVQTDVNKGYSYGNNYGIAYLKNHDLLAEYVVISNPDISIKEPVLDELLFIIDSNDKIGIAAPMMNIQGKSPFKTSAWKQTSYSYDLISALPFSARIFKLNNNYSDKFFNKNLVNVDIVSGAFFVTRRLFVDKEKLFDEDIFLYCEERILCKKINDKGYKNIICTKISYNHLESVSISKTYQSQLQKTKLLFASRKTYWKKYGDISFTKKTLLFFVFDFYIFFKSLFCKISKEVTND